MSYGQQPPGQYGPPPGQYGPPAFSAPAPPRSGPPLWFTISTTALLALILVFAFLTWNTNRAAHSREVDYSCKTLKYDYDGEVKDETTKRDEILADVYGCSDSDLP